MSPDDADERQSTGQVLAFLEPFLLAMQIPFVKFEPKTAVELLAFLDQLEIEAKAGWRPIIHIDTHGGETDGLYVAASKEFITWKELTKRLRPIAARSTWMAIMLQIRGEATAAVQAATSHSGTTRSGKPGHVQVPPRLGNRRAELGFA